MFLYYCDICTRVIKEEKCPYCTGEGITLKKNAPVNVIGTKIKGRVFKQADENISIIVVNEDNSKSIKEYSPSKLRKIL